MSRKPDYDLSAMNKHTDEKARVGAAWKEDDGSISIVMTPFVTLQSSKSLVLKLFPCRIKADIRNDALEEAAKVAESSKGYPTAESEAIRALKDVS